MVLTFRRTGLADPRILIGAIVALLMAGTTPVSGQSSGPTEYQLKAVFLFNFAQFVEWPAAAYAAPDDSLIIGVLGQDPFGTYLDNIVRGEQVGSHHLAVRRYASVEDVTDCQILFVSKLDKSRLERLFGRLKERPVLTVGDAEGFARMGGMIRFISDHNRIRLRINLPAAESANLKLSSKLLRPAEIVGQARE